MDIPTQSQLSNDDGKNQQIIVDKWWHFSRSDIISSCAFVFSIVTLYLQCSSQEEQDFTNRSFESRPRLELAGQPQVKGFGVKTEFIDPTLFSSRVADGVREISVKADIEANIVYKLTNEGAGVAKVLAVIIGCDDNEFPILRDLLFKDSLTNVSGFPRFEEIVPGDTFNYDVSANLTFFPDSSTFLHVLIVYANEFDNYYDSYFCAEIAGSDFSFLFGLDSTNIPRVASFQTIGGVPLRKAIRMKSSANDMYKTYTREECAKLESVLERLSQRIPSK